MGKSRKKHPVTSMVSTGHNSLKSDKRKANRSLRKTTKGLLRNIQNGDMDADDYVDLDLTDVSNRATFADDDSKFWMSEDYEQYNKSMRK